MINLIEENGGEVSEEILTQLALTEEQFEQKAVSYSNVVKVFENDVKIIDDEIERLQAMKERKAKAKEAFKTKLDEAMRLFNIPLVETPTRKISYLKSEVVEIEDEEDIPNRYKKSKTTITVSKSDIKADLKKGVAVPGAKLVTKQNLQIK